MHSMYDWLPSYSVFLPPLLLCLLHAFNNFFTAVSLLAELNKVNGSCLCFGNVLKVGLEDIELIPILDYKLKPAELSSE